MRQKEESRAGVGATMQYERERYAQSDRHCATYSLSTDSGNDRIKKVNNA